MSSEDLNDEAMDALAIEQMERDRDLDERIVTSLECVPDLSLRFPSDFAARVAAKVPARRTVVVSTTHYGRTAMWCCLALLMVLLMSVAAKGSGRSAIGIAIEWTLYAQFLAIAVWLAVRRLNVN